MGRIGDGYGSEFHLRRLLREDPEKVSSAVAAAAGPGSSSVEWLPFPKDELRSTGDREFAGMEFIEDRPEVLEEWAAWWPRTGRPPSWDAIGRLSHAGESAWLLLEAKANAVEFCSPPTAAGEESRRKIEAAFSEVKRHLGVHRSFRWTDTYYQYANRLAVLYFLQVKMREPARLVFLYFCGDRFPDDRPCPQSSQEWEPLQRACHVTLGLQKEHRLAPRVHEVFLDV